MEATIYDIARRAGVSAMTVSRVLNRTNAAIAVSESTKQKVKEIAKELNYTPNFMAKALRKGQSGLIGVVIPDVTFSYLPETLEGIESFLRQQQSSLLLCTTKMNVHQETGYLKLLYAKKVDGVIIWPSGTEAQLEESLQPFLRQKKAVISIYRKLHLPGVRNISVDTHAGAYAATQYLIKKGHRRIACRKLLQPTRDIAPMISGYRDALEDNGIKFDETLLKPMDTYQATYCAMQEFLAMKQPPTAVYTTGDHQAFGAINAVNDAGLKIPGDIAIIGNNDIKFASMSSPELTTVMIPKQEVGLLAGKIIFDILDQKEARDVELTPELVIRKST